MFRVEDLSKRAEILHLRSTGVVADDEKGKKITTYFFPSLVFSTSVQVLSITLLCKYSKTKASDMEVKLTFQDPITSNLIVKTEKEHILKHAPGILVTTLFYPKPITIGANQPLYFISEGDYPNSVLTLSYRNI
jgi:hypothetical protein